MRKILLLTVAAFLTTCGFAAHAENQNSYNVLVLGDMHHDARDLRVTDPGNKPEFKRNTEAWEKFMPAMLDAAATCANKECAFAIQCGDITQGDEGSYELSIASFTRVLAQVESRLQIPFYPIRGNHDVRGEGKRKASDDILLPRMKKLVGFPQDTQSQTCYKVVGKDLFIFTDSEGNSLDAIREILKKNTGMRHIFFVTHLPVVPCVLTLNSYWICCWNKPAQRQALRKLLAENNVIVLCAHTHSTALFKWQFPEGSITQFTSFSIASASTAVKSVQTGTEKEFFQRIEELIADKTQPARMAKKQEYVQKILPEYRDAKLQYSVFLRGRGYNILRVKGNEVFMDIYPGKSTQPGKTVKLK